jgi:hypothetical protein
MASKPCPKFRFTSREDTNLTEAVNMVGSSDWKLVAEWIPGRTARQCRERWTNYLSPSLIDKPWTEEEDVILYEKYAELGPKWRLLKNFLEGRSRNAIRNRWLALHRHTSNRAHVQSTFAQSEGQAEDNRSPVKASPETADPFGFLEGRQGQFAISWRAEVNSFDDDFFY